MVSGFREERGLEDPSNFYIDNKRKHFKKCGEKIIKNSLTIYQYKSLGISPRILPEKHPSTTNSMNKFFFVFLGDYTQKNITRFYWI